MFHPVYYPRKLMWLQRHLGFYHSAVVCGAKVVDLLTRPFTSGEWFPNFVGARYDARYGVDTYKTVPTDELGLSAEEIEQAEHYEPADVMGFGFLIEQLDVPHQEYTFVDLGSGKGRALLLATEFPFKAIVGVEISQPMHEIALQNIENFSASQDASRLSSVCEDAGKFEFPADPLVVFLFNSFHEVILARVIENLERSIERTPRHVIVVYVNPRHADVFDNAKLLKNTRNDLSGWFLTYEYSPAGASNGAGGAS